GGPVGGVLGGRGAAPGDLVLQAAVVDRIRHRHLGNDPGCLTGDNRASGEGPPVADPINGEPNGVDESALGQELDGDGVDSSRAAEGAGTCANRLSERLTAV